MDLHFAERTLRAVAISLVGLATLAACARGPGDTPTARPPDNGAPASADLLIVGGWPDPTVVRETLLPLSLEAWAEVIAVGRVHEPFLRNGRRLLKLELTEIIKGRTAAGTLFPGDSQPWLGCLPPATVPRPSERFPPGSEVLIYLDDEPGEGLSILGIWPLGEGRSIESVRRYVEIEASFLDPEADFTDLLPADGTLDHVTHWALYHSYPTSDSLRPALRAMLEHAAAQLDRGQRVGMDHLANLLYQLSHGSALADLPAADAASWVSLLEALRAYAGRDLSMIEGLFGALVRLPDGAGLPVLLREIDMPDARVTPGALQMLGVWARSHPDDREGRALLRARIDRLLANPLLQSEEYGAVRRRLELLRREVRERAP